MNTWIRFIVINIIATPTPFVFTFSHSCKHFWDPKMFTTLREHGYSEAGITIIVSTLKIMINSIIVIPTSLYPCSLTVVNILGSQKCALLLDVP